MTKLLLLCCACCCAGCVVSRARLTETTADGTQRELRLNNYAGWPATQTLDKQRASIGKTLSAGNSGLEQGTGSTNVVEALKALDSILSKIH
jgi:hypothetical protein